MLNDKVLVNNWCEIFECGVWELVLGDKLLLFIIIVDVCMFYEFVVWVMDVVGCFGFVKLSIIIEWEGEV